jgi:hypothetical protein
MLHPLRKSLLACLCDFLLIGCEIEPLQDYLLPVVILLSIVFFKVINLFGKEMFVSCNLLLELLHRGLNSL